MRHRQTKETGTDRLHLRDTAPVLDPTHSFDAGYVTVTPDYKFRASRKLNDDFHNGEEYLRMNGSGIWLPRDSDCRPNREFLEWHSDTVFRR